MVNEDYKALRLRAISYAHFRGMQSPEHCEDFAQDYCLAVFEGKQRSLAKCFTDYMRKVGGRIYKKGVKHAKYFSNLDYEELQNISDSPLMAPPIDPIRKVQYRELRSALTHLNAREMLVASLHLRGFNQPEIAERMGLSASRISQVWTLICCKLRKKLC